MPLDIASIRLRRPDTQIHYLPTVDSTMREAARLSEGGCQPGTVVLADEQTAGIGRLGRTWHSQANAGIYCSVVLRIPLAPADLPVATLMLGVATAEAIEDATNLMCDLRWPNDVLINGRKTAGILAQLLGAFVIAGIGINVNHRELPAGLRTPATSILLESGGAEQSREAILIRLLETLEAGVELLAAGGKQAILRAFEVKSSYVRDRRVIVEESGSEGITAGLDASGFLLLRRDNGLTERVATGGVRPV